MEMGAVSHSLCRVELLTESRTQQQSEQGRKDRAPVSITHGVVGEWMSMAVGEDRSQAG